MRKKARRYSFLPEVINKSVSVIQTSNQEQQRFSNRINLSRFNVQLTKNLIQNTKNNYRQTKGSRFKLQNVPLEPIVLKNLPQITKDIKSIKQEIRKMSLQKQQKKINKISRLVTEMEVRNRYASLSNTPVNQQQYCPMPIPYFIPMPMPHNPYLYDANTNYPPNNHPHPHHFNARKSRSDPKKNVRRWRKVVHCIMFTFYLRRFCKLIQKNRLQNFKKMLNKIKTNLLFIRNKIIKSISDFLTILYSKKDVSFDFTQGSTSSILKQKISSIRKLIKILIENLSQGLMNFSKSSQLIEVIYYLCRHGNYSCTEPLLTKEEMDISCISTSFQYISADNTLEKVNLINLFFIKLLIYNTLLSSQKINDNLAEEEIPNNLYVVSSVLYEFIIFIQDEFMSNLNPVYQIGNYRKNKKVRYLQPLKYKTETQIEGELISGLIEQNIITKYFDFSLWSQQANLIKQMLTQLQKLMSNYHKSYSKKFY